MRIVVSDCLVVPQKWSCVLRSLPSQLPNKVVVSKNTKGTNIVIVLLEGISLLTQVPALLVICTLSVLHGRHNAS